MMIVVCPHCDYEGQPVAGQERVRRKRVWLCESCSGILPNVRTAPQRKKPRWREEDDLDWKGYR